MAKIFESTITPAVATAKPTRLGTYLRNTPPVSGSFIQEDDYSDLLNFMVNLDFDSWVYIEDFENLGVVLSDLEYIGRTGILNEGVLRAKKSSNSKLAYSRKWYKRNRSKLAKARKKLAKSAEGLKRRKKKEIMARQKKNRHGKPLRKYPRAKGHTNERISFAEMVQPLSQKHSVKDIIKKKGNPQYFMAEQPLQLGDLDFKENDVFILDGTTLKFEKGNNKYTIENIPSEIFQYLRRI